MKRRTYVVVAADGKIRPRTFGSLGEARRAARKVANELGCEARVCCGPEVLERVLPDRYPDRYLRDDVDLAMRIGLEPIFPIEEV